MLYSPPISGVWYIRIAFEIERYGNSTAAGSIAKRRAAQTIPKQNFEITNPSFPGPRYILGAFGIRNIYKESIVLINLFHSGNACLPAL